MGCQVYCGVGLAIRYSRGAWLLEKMCRPWFDPDRDTDSDGYYQDSIDSTSLQSADKEVPQNFEDFKLWAASKNIDLDERTDENDFRQCREFLADAAKTGRSASLSH